MPAFSIFFPGDIRWSWFHQHLKEQTRRFSIQLDSSWYNSKFKGFGICFRVPLVIVQKQKHSDAKSERGSRWLGSTKVTAKLVRKYDRQVQDELRKKCSVVACQVGSLGSKYAICFSYIPFAALWHTSDSEKGKEPNEYCFFEASIDPCIATKWGLYMVYEDKLQQIDESQNSDMFRESNDDQGLNLEGTSVKRRRVDFHQSFHHFPGRQEGKSAINGSTSCSRVLFQHRQEYSSCSSGQLQTSQLSQANQQVDDELVNETTSSCMVVEQPEAPSSSRSSQISDLSDEQKENAVTNGSSSSEVFQQLESPSSSGQTHILQLFPEHS